MAPMTFPSPRDARRLSIFEEYILRFVTLFFIRAAQDTSRFTYVKRIYSLCKKVTYSLGAKERYKYLSSLAITIRRLAYDIGITVVIRSVSRIPGLGEFCQFVHFHPWIRKQWEPIILTCTWLSPSTWTRSGLRRPRLDVLRAATANWEWTCFRHYRESFKYWALHGRPCHTCVSMLHAFPQNIEYDKPGLAYRFINASFTFLNCLPRSYLRMRYIISSLEPLVMIIYQTKNLRWLIWWDPLIRMQAGFSAGEIYRSYSQRNTEHDAIERDTTPQARIARSMFEYRDLIYVEENLSSERFLLEERIREHRILVDTGAETRSVHYYPALL